MFFRLAHLQIGQDIALQYSHDHSNIRGTTSNAESISFGPTQRQDTTSNIMNPDVKASGGESSVINSIFSLTEPEVDGGVLDIHEGQHLEVVARGNSCTEDTDLVEPAGEEPGRMEQGRLAPAVETARVEADGSLVQDEPPGESLAAESIEQAGQDRIDKELIDRDRVMAETAEVQLGKSGDPLWPGWTSEILSEGWRQNRLYWVPPSREIAFREWQQAHDFEHLRVECDNDEDKALAELKKTTTKKIRYKRLSKPRHKTKRVTKAIGQRAITKIGATTMKTKESTSIEASSSKSDKNPPPGTGWRFDVATGGEGDNNRCHWFSPTRNIEFRRRKQACEFEDLIRKQFGADEIKAWAEYREMKHGQPTRVVSPEQYDVETHLNRATKEIALSERGKQQNRTPLPRSGQMTGRFRKPMAVDQKCASSLVGLRLKVPAHWWNNCSGNTLYAGQIADINFSDDAKRYFMLKLDSEENRNLHPMRYDAVLRYADKEHPTHSRFDLPERPPAPADPNVTESGKRKCREELVQAVPNYDVETHLNRATKEIALSERGKQQNRTPLPRSGQMTGRFRKPMAVDQKCASSLVGLRLKVPAHWWNNCSGNTLYAGQIADINFSDDAKRYFMLKLDSEENRNLHPMRYDAVLRYADKEHPTHSRFDLPERPPAPADPNVTESGKRKCREELVQAVPEAKKLQKTSHKAAKKLPIGCIKSKGKNTPVVKSTKNRFDSPARKLYDKDSTPSYLWVSPSKLSARPSLNDGLNCSNIKITRLKETKKTSFFEDKFNGRILLVESSLNHEAVPEKTVTYVSEHG